jgi:hypothetical protein
MWQKISSETKELPEMVVTGSDRNPKWPPNLNRKGNSKNL